MREIKINANSTEATIGQLQQYVGGTISETHGEYRLDFDSEIGNGSIKCFTFDWGVSLMEVEGFFLEELLIVNDNEAFNPIHFSYCSKGQFGHRIGEHGDYNMVLPYHSSIIAAAKGTKHYTLIPKNIEVVLHDICVVRHDFFKKRLNNIIQLNEKLYSLFMDGEGEKTFAFYGAFLLKMEDHVKAMRTADGQGMSRMLKIEGEIYQILAMHIARHSCSSTSNLLPKGLCNTQLKTARSFADMIVKEPSDDYSLEALSQESGLAQAKLQECFKFLYARTVTDFIRNSRLEAAHELMQTSDLNISQIVYTIGFTSRSYFSKIFKQKYRLTPNEYKKQTPMLLEMAL